MDAIRFLLSWAAVYIGFFSLAQTKLPNYVLPAYPPLAILTARFLVRWRRGEAAVARWAMPAALACLGLIGVGVAVGLLVAAGVLVPAAMAGQEIAGLVRWAWLGAVPVVGAAAGYRCLRLGSRAGVVTALAATAVAFVGLGSALPPRAAEGRKAARALVAAAGACRPGEEVRVAGLAYFQPSLVFYCRREVGELFSVQQALDLLRGPLPAYVFCPAAMGDALAAQAGPDCRVAGRHPDLYRGIDVAVVTNQH